MYLKGIAQINTYCLFLLPGLHGRFVLLELVAPVGVDFLIVIALVRWSASKRNRNKQLYEIDLSLQS